MHEMLAEPLTSSFPSGLEVSLHKDQHNVKMHTVWLGGEEETHRECTGVCMSTCARLCVYVCVCAVQEANRAGVSQVLN